MIEIEHDPRCWLAASSRGEDAPEICTCEQIAQLEEQARSVLPEAEPIFTPPPSLPHYIDHLAGAGGIGGIGTAYVPYGTYIGYTTTTLSSHATVYDPGKVKVDELAAKRAEIYAKSDAKREWDPNPLRWLKGKGFSRE